MLRIGLTGGIGAGKSTVALVLRELGAVVVDADALAREVVAPGTPGLAAVVAQFGRQVLSADGGLDRPALARLVFGDDERRRALEAITHPLVAGRTAELVAASPADAIVVHDVPLIVEKQMGGLYHLVLVVDAPAEVRVRRLVSSRPMSEDDARARIRSQATAQQRRAAADVWVDTDRAPEAVAADVRRLWDERLVPFERNVRTRTVVRRPDAVVLEQQHEQWAAEAARLVARLRTGAAGRALAVEHIGSTAVPGLPAKPVLDLQLAVRSMADADAVREQLADAGFPRLPDVMSDVPVPEVEPDAGRWVKRLHGGADPAALLHLHVRRHDGPGWRTALLQRDWLRAVPEELAAYRAEKERLAAAGGTAVQYAEDKDAWWAGATPRALRWAAETGWTPTS